MLYEVITAVSLQAPAFDGHGVTATSLADGGNEDMHAAGDADHLVAFLHIALIAAQQTGVEHHPQLELIRITVDDEETDHLAFVVDPGEAMQVAIPHLAHRDAHLILGIQRYRLGGGEPRRLGGHQVPVEGGQQSQGQQGQQADTPAASYNFV